MSIYFKSGKGWRYDFTLNRRRYTGAWFKSKRKAKEAEAEKRKEVIREQSQPETPTDMGFLELVNRRLDYVKAYHSPKHYDDYRYMAKRWIDRWGDLMSKEISPEMVEKFILERSLVSPYTANKEVRYLRATFNFGKKKRLTTANPTEDIAFLPAQKKVKYVPSPEEIDKLIGVAEQDAREYLCTLRDTLGRMSEINRLTWDDVDLKNRAVLLWTRKKKGGHLTPREVPMTERLLSLLSERFAQRDPEKPWVFWHTYWSSKTGEKCEGPFQDRKRLMKSLCKKAGIRYFRFHALRHSGASVMENNHVPIGPIQRILGHENRTTTEIYLHSIGESERAAVRVFERVTGKSHTESHTGQLPAEGQPSVSN